MKLRLLFSFLSIAAMLLGVTGNAEAQSTRLPGEFGVDFTFADQVSQQQQDDLLPSLDIAANFWESVIVGYRDGVTLNGVSILVSVEDIDGANGVLAAAGPAGNLTNQGGFTFVTNSAGTISTGGLTVDSADFSTSLIVDVLKHEIGHVLGFVPAVFELNGLIGGDGEYTGTEGLLAYQQEFDALAEFIPLQNDPATATSPAVINAHLDENNTLEDAFGRNISNELLTPIIANGTNAENPELNFLSNTSVGIFRDLGFNAIAPASFAVPEPSSLALLAFGAAVVVTRRRRSLGDGS